MKVITKLISIILFFPCLSLSKDIDLLDVYNLSQNSYEDFLIANENIIIDNQNKKISGSSFLPTASISLNRTQIDNNLSSDYYDSTTVYVSQPIFNYYNISTNLSANLRQKLGELDYQQKHQDAILTIAKAYIDVLNAQISLQNSLSQLKFIDKNLQIVEQRHNNYEASDSDLIQAKYDKQKLLSDIENAKNILNISKLSLAHIVNSTDELDLKSNVLVEQLYILEPNNDINELLEMAMQNNIYIKKYKLNKDIVKQDIETAKSGFYPVIDLQATYVDDGYKMPFKGTREVSINFSIPLFGGSLGGLGSDLNNLKKANSALNIANLNLNKMSKNISQQVYADYNKLLFASNSIKTLAELKNYRERELDIVKAEFSSYGKTYKDLFLAEKFLWDIKTSYSQSINNYILSYLQLRKTLGVLSVDDLIIVNSLIY